jgi:hypothetical protein
MTNNQEQDIKIEHILAALRAHIGELAQEIAVQKATIIALTARLNAPEEELEPKQDVPRKIKVTRAEDI